VARRATTTRAHAMRGTKAASLLAEIWPTAKLFNVTALRRVLTAPEDYLRKAMAARTPTMRARYARQGLATRSRLDRTTQAMLLRQLYLAQFEARKFEAAHKIALQAIELDVLSDVLHQDAARAAIASGDLDAALGHLRTAARRSPASRRPFHWWTLGAALFLAQRYDESIAALTRATRWGTKDKPLYRAHLALARVAAGEPVRELQDTIDALAQAPCGQGYGRFVLGHLAYAAREWPAAKRYLEAFVRRTEAARPAMGIALDGELRMSRATLAKMGAN
jgi:tetratricopeptide (TPR) repeat protein